MSIAHIRCSHFGLECPEDQQKVYFRAKAPHMATEKLYDGTYSKQGNRYIVEGSMQAFPHSMVTLWEERR